MAARRGRGGHRMKVATRWRALVMAGGLVALPVRSRAQEAPPDTLTDYVFLALKRLDVLGPVRLDSGSVGVNETGKGQDHRITVDQPLLLDPVTGVIAADRTDLNQPSTCATVFANSGTGDCVGAGGVQPLEVTQLVADPLAACGYPDNFPACGKEDMTIGEDETLTLPEGTYGDVTVSSGTLILSGGEYVFCSLTVEDSTVRAEKPSMVQVERQIDIRGASILNPDLPTSDFRVLSETTHVDIIIMGSQTLLRGSVCSVFRGGQATMPQVRALLCAPKAKLDVKNARVEGTFLAMDIDIAMVTGGNVGAPPDHHDDLHDQHHDFYNQQHHQLLLDHHDLDDLHDRHHGRDDLNHHDAFDHYVLHDYDLDVLVHLDDGNVPDLDVHVDPGIDLDHQHRAGMQHPSRHGVPARPVAGQPRRGEPHGPRSSRAGRLGRRQPAGYGRRLQREPARRCPALLLLHGWSELEKAGPAVVRACAAARAGPGMPARKSAPDHRAQRNRAPHRGGAPGGPVIGRGAERYERHERHGHRGRRQSLRGGSGFHSPCGGTHTPPAPPACARVRQLSCGRLHGRSTASVDLTSNPPPCTFSAWALSFTASRGVHCRKAVSRNPLTELPVGGYPQPETGARSKW
jgi:hypothetical protein